LRERADNIIDEREGRLFLRALGGRKEWVLDAEPQVMVLFERLFPSSKVEHAYQWSTEAGKRPDLQFTHRPRIMADSTSARKDIDWFSNRYQLEISGVDRLYLREGAISYDATQREAKQAFINYERVELPFITPLRGYQEQAVALILHRRQLLVADQVGLGKTPVGIALGARHAPCLVVVPTHLVTQWSAEIKKFLPVATVHCIKQRKLYDLPAADFYIVSYHLVYSWHDIFTTKMIPQALVLDEVHSLRHDNTEKYRTIRAIAEVAGYRVGLSATPIMNYGTEIFNIFQILEPGALGDPQDFRREWCTYDQKLRDPVLFGNFLRKHMMMVRRTRREVGRELEAVNRQVYTVDADMATLQRMEEEAKILAMKIITGTFHEAGEAAREFDYKMRHATGVAKARAVAEIVKMILESGEKVLLFGWHRDVYDIWLKELSAYRPVMYTGTESAKQKDAALQEFIEGDAQVFIMSLRSGAGVNGLQTVCHYAVFGELDWSPGIHEQAIGRLWREGIKEQVDVLFVTIEDGADPIMKKVLGAKTSEAKQILHPEAEALTVTSDTDHIYTMAKEWLRSKGTDVDRIIVERQAEQQGELFIAAPTKGTAAHRIWTLLTESVYATNHEDLLQEEIIRTFEEANIPYEREVRLSEESRVDFKVGHILIECKAGRFNKKNLLRQIKRYKRDYPAAEAIMIITPENLKHFQLEGLAIYTVNTSNASLLAGTLS
jgi:superfamily II DNA or RNA helicase